MFETFKLSYKQGSPCGITFPTLNLITISNYVVVVFSNDYRQYLFTHVYSVYRESTRECGLMFTQTEVSRIK